MRWQNIFSVLCEKKTQSSNVCPMWSICNCQVYKYNIVYAMNCSIFKDYKNEHIGG